MSSFMGIISNHNSFRVLFNKLRSCILYEKYINISALEMTSRANRHCIGALSFSIDISRAILLDYRSWDPRAALMTLLLISLYTVRRKANKHLSNIYYNQTTRQRETAMTVLTRLDIINSRVFRRTERWLFFRQQGRVKFDKTTH